MLIKIYTGSASRTCKGILMVTTKQPLLLLLFMNNTPVLNTAPCKSAVTKLAVSAESTPKKKPLANSLNTMKKKPELGTLTAALEQAQLDMLLKDKDGVTLFAPTNQAFIELTQGVRGRLFNRQNKDQLTKLLRGHMVAGSYTTRQLKARISDKAAPKNPPPAPEKTPLITLAGDELTITENPAGELVVNNARIIKSIKTSNGYVYIVDAALG